MIAKDFVPPWARGDFDYYKFTVCRSIASVGAQQGAVWRQPLSVVGAFDDDLVAGVGHPVEGAVVQDAVVEQAQPFVDGPVVGDDEAGRPVPVEDAFVEIGGLLWGKPVQS